MKNWVYLHILVVMPLGEMVPQGPLPLLPPLPGNFGSSKALITSLPTEGAKQGVPGRCPPLQQEMWPNTYRDKAENVPHNSRSMAKDTNPNRSQSQGISSSWVKNWVGRSSGVCIVVYSFTTLRIIYFLAFTSGKTKYWIKIDYRTWHYLNVSLVTLLLP